MCLELLGCTCKKCSVSYRDQGRVGVVGSCSFTLIITKQRMAATMGTEKEAKRNGFPRTNVAKDVEVT